MQIRWSVWYRHRTSSNEDQVWPRPHLRNSFDLMKIWWNVWYRHRTSSNEDQVWPRPHLRKSFDLMKIWWNVWYRQHFIRSSSIFLVWMGTRVFSSDNGLQMNKPYFIGVIDKWEVINYSTVNHFSLWPIYSSKSQTYLKS